MTPDPEVVREWALVLDSQGIPYRIAHHPEGPELVLHPRDAERAAAALRAYAWENAPHAPPARQASGARRSLVAVAASVLLIAFHGVTGSWSSDSWWFLAGAADAAAIRQGEVWRLLTALTLHADFGHVLANAVTLALFGTAVASIVGSGAGAWLVLLSGALGNAANVALRWGPYSGVGASTAVFGAVGVLAGLQIVPRQPRFNTRGQAIAAGVLLLVLLGMSEQSDILAHVLGFLAGIVLGAVWARSGLGVGGARARRAMLAAAALTVASCWWLARMTLG